jgi:hypothetical protein
MAHNKSLRAQLTRVMGSPIDHYRLWYLTVRCPSCRDRKTLSIQRALRAGEGGQKVAQFIARLRCQTCGRAPDSIKLHNQAGPNREIVLYGPGAY